jgi:hypothetical protein
MVEISAPVLYSQAIVIKTDVTIFPYTFSYEGPKANILVKNFKKDVAIAIGLPEEEVKEQNFSVSRKEKEFINASFRLTKAIDKYSYYLFEFSYNAILDLEGNGKFDANFKVTVYTEYPKVTLWQRSIFYEIWRSLFHEFFYKHQIEKYKIEGLKILKKIEEVLRNEIKV